MARFGSFGGSLNPFGSGTLGSLSQYDIGENLAELEVYKVSVAWGNGTATDEEYLAALQKAVDMTGVGTKKREAAQNRKDDAVYSIGRSKAQEEGLDELIAFDQASLARMTPGNERYRNVSQSLDSELAQRRSRDYGKLVDEYNSGKASTDDLIKWVSDAQETIQPDDPDYDNWASTAKSLAERKQSERDDEVYQDYQMGRMKPAAFLAYIQGRRDAFTPTSPDYATWDRKLEDATKSVNDAALAKADTAFFNAYDEGKKSDKDYLSYLNRRIAGMKADDPDLPSWKHRLAQAAFSLAEDQLRFDVQTGKAPVSRLVTFYKHYQLTLNRGSAEWRTIQRNLISLGSSSGGGSGGSGGGGGGGTGGGGTKSSGSLPKIISSKYTLDSIGNLLVPNVNGDPATRRAWEKALDSNIASLGNAKRNSDSVWLFQDPRNPGQQVQRQNPDGSLALDAQGNPVMVNGSAYLPVTDQAYGNLLGAKGQYHRDLGALALAHHDTAGFFYQNKLANNLEDDARSFWMHTLQADDKKRFDAADKAIDLAMKTGDFTTAMNIAMELQAGLDADLADGTLSDTARSALKAMSDKLAANPLMPQVDANGVRRGGAIDTENSTTDSKGQFTNVAILPGWHFSLDSTDEKGVADWRLVRDDKQDGTWEESHVKVHTAYGDKLVTGEVKVRGGSEGVSVNPTAFVRTDHGMVPIKINAGANYITYTDEFGNQVQAYSLDGSTWIRSLTGTVPSVEYDLAGLKAVPGADGSLSFFKLGDEHDRQGTVEVARVGPNGEGIQFAKGVDPSQYGDWYGIGNAARYAKTGGYVPTTAGQAKGAEVRLARTGTDRAGRALTKDQMSDPEALYMAGARKADVGGLGQSMQVAYMSPSGELDLTNTASDAWRAWEDKPYQKTLKETMAPYQRKNATAIRAVQKTVQQGRGGTVRGVRNYDLTAADSASSGGYESSYRVPLAVRRVALDIQKPADTPPSFQGVGLLRPAQRNIDLQIAPVSKLSPPRLKSKAVLKLSTAEGSAKSLRVRRAVPKLKAARTLKQEETSLKSPTLSGGRVAL